jgi:hypothetical protein
MGDKGWGIPCFGDLDRVIFTCVFGYTDPLHEPEIIYKKATSSKDYSGKIIHRPEIGCPMICFTDQPISSNAWEIVRVPTVDAPKRVSRFVKALSHRWFPKATTLYIDANMTLRIHLSALEANYEGDFVNFRHWKRNRITDEADAIIRCKKAKPEAVMAQLRKYQAEGFDTDANPQKVLSNNGVILRRPGSAELCEAWWHEISTQTLRDQMSIDYCAWKLRHKIQRFRGNIKSTGIVTVHNYVRPVNDY